MRKIFCWFAVSLLVLLVSCYHKEKQIDDFVSDCENPDALALDSRLEDVSGNYQLAVYSSHHNIFAMGGQRTEYQFVICPDGKVTVSDSENKVLKVLFYEVPENDFYSVYLDYKTLSIENISEQAPFQEVFKFSLAKEFQKYTIASYSTYDGAITLWSDSPKIRGKSVPQELDALSGIYDLVSDYGDMFTLEIDHGTLTLRDSKDWKIAMVQWDGEFDTVEASEVDTDVLKININADQNNQRMLFSYDVDREVITTLNFEDGDRKTFLAEQ